MFAPMTYAIKDFMEGSGSTFEEVVEMLEEQLEDMEESIRLAQ
jgi:hypothetical protein